MDQEDPIDFKALMAKFQDDEMLLTQPRIKPAVPTKPKDLPPPTSPTSPTLISLPAGARPSLLTSISLATQSKTPLAPRVIFKDDKEVKKPLIQSNSKKKKLGKDKDAGLKGAKDKSESAGEGKQKDKKGGATELVSVAPPPKTSTQKKKGFLTFKKPGKKGVSEEPAEAILDIPSPDDLGQKLLLPTLSTFKEPVPESPLSITMASTPKQALIPHTLAPATPSLPAAVAAPPSLVPAAPVVPAAAAIPDLPAPEVTAPPIETPPVILQAPPAPPSTTPPRALPPPPVVPKSPLLVTPTPRVIRTLSPPATPTPSPLPPPEFDDDSQAEEVVVDGTAVEETLAHLSLTPSPPPSPSPPPVIRPVSIPPSPTPPVSDPPSIPPSPTPPVVDLPCTPPFPPAIHSPSISPSPPVPVLDPPSVPPSPAPPVIDPPVIPPSPGTAVVNTLSIPPSPKVERPLSAQSMLERVEEKGPVRKTYSIDQRVYNALQKAKQKKSSPLTTPSPSNPGTPTTEELPRLASPVPLPVLPPIDYDKQTKGTPRSPLKPQVNELEHTRHASLGLEGGDPIPEMMVVPLPPPRRILPEALSPGPTPEKHGQPPAFLLPPLQMSAVEVPAPSELIEEDSGPDVPEFEDGGGEVLELEASGLCASKALESEVNGNGMTIPEPDVLNAAGYSVPFRKVPKPKPLADSLNGQDIAGCQVENIPIRNGEDIYEEVKPSGTKKKEKSEATKKRKGPPKNPYDEAQQPATEQTPKTVWFAKNDKKTTPEGPDEKELKKKEKQRLEKEKKEQKEQREREKKEQKEQREREQKEQKEQQKKENEMKKKFKITGQEDAMYQAKVTVTSKGRKNDLPITSGDMVSIIRTTNCPKGKWLARDSQGTCGYIAVSDVELDIKEMMELGKKTQAVNKKNNNHLTEVEVPSSESRTSDNARISTGSFTDDSEEWTGDEDEPLSPTDHTDHSQVGHNRTLSMPEMGSTGLDVVHQHTFSDPIGHNVQARQQALHKLSTFFHSPKDSIGPEVEQPAARSHEEETSTVEEEPECSPELPETFILPPPDLYADLSFS